MTAERRWLAASVLFSLLLHSTLLSYRLPSWPKPQRAMPVVFRLQDGQVASNPVAISDRPARTDKRVRAPEVPIPIKAPDAPRLAPRSRGATGTNVRLSPAWRQPKVISPPVEQPTATKAPAAAANASARDAGSMEAQPPPGAVRDEGTGSASARASYEQLLAAWIERHKYYPQLARRRGIEGTALLRVALHRDGAIAASALERTTRHDVLDEAALDIIRRSGPFPPVPEEIIGDDFEFSVPIRFKLE